MKRKIAAISEPFGSFNSERASMIMAPYLANKYDVVNRFQINEDNNFKIKWNRFHAKSINSHTILSVWRFESWESYLRHFYTSAGLSTNIPDKPCPLFSLHFWSSKCLLQPRCSSIQWKLKWYIIQKLIWLYILFKTRPRIKEATIWNKMNGDILHLLKSISIVWVWPCNHPWINVFLIGILSMLWTTMHLKLELLIN